MGRCETSCGSAGNSKFCLKHSSSQLSVGFSKLSGRKEKKLFVAVAEDLIRLFKLTVFHSFSAGTKAVVISCFAAVSVRAGPWGYKSRMELSSVCNLL